MSKKSKKKHTVQSLTKQLKKSMESYLDKWVKTPSLQTVDKEFTVQKDIGTILVLLKTTEGLILDHGKDIYLDNMSGFSQEELENAVNILNSFVDSCDPDYNRKKVDKILNNHINKKNLIAYLVREINWISISILSASYISSLILTRSIFELLIGMSTNKNGSMTGRIESIKFLSEEEQKYLKQSWNKLNAWAHPYGKWEKEICPVFYSTDKPLFHPSLYKECFSKFVLLTDLFLTIAVERFKISPQEIKVAYEKVGSEITTECGEHFPMFSCRLSH